jgi:hypothetical protein
MAHRSKPRSNRAKRLPKNSGPKIVRLELDEKALARLIAGEGDILPSLPNMRDNFVIRKLCTAKAGDLPVDRFGGLFLKGGGSPGESHIIALRLALIRVYFAAANVRLYARATRDQVKSAEAALTALTSAIKQLDQVRPPRHRGLQGAFGSPMDDQKGLDEFNDFGSRCSQISMDIVPIMMALSHAIETEKKKPKPAKAGERKKRLRTLVEELAICWKSVTGKSLAPYVHAKRLDHRPALVIARRGRLVELAQALFSEVDEFTDSEVISAVTNVHENQLLKEKH